MVEPFKKLSLRLKEGEVGLVKTPFGWHVIKRVPPPPPDPLDSADILSATPVTQKAKVKHILLGWTEVHADDPRGTKRTRAELEKLVKETVAKLKKGDEDRAAHGGALGGSGLGEVGRELRRHAGRRASSSRSRTCRCGSSWARSAWSRPPFGIHIIQRVE